MNTRAFNPGFRISEVDAIVLILGTVSAVGVGVLVPWFGIAIAFVIGHFFLFCNVVRMARPREVAWATIFVALSISTVVMGSPSWPTSLAISFVTTVIFVAGELRKPSYHGVFWRRINPNLPQWWDANSSA